MKKLLALSLLALSGCGADVATACQNYFDAYETCVNDYADANGMDASSLVLSDTYCDDTYGDTKDQASADYLNCLADAYNATDCSDSAAYAAVDLSGCTL